MHKHRRPVSGFAGAWSRPVGATEEDGRVAAEDVRAMPESVRVTVESPRAMAEDFGVVGESRCIRREDMPFRGEDVPFAPEHTRIGREDTTIAADVAWFFAEDVSIGFEHERSFASVDAISAEVDALEPSHVDRFAELHGPAAESIRIGARIDISRAPIRQPFREVGSGQENRHAHGKKRPLGT
jgi:hypothetical protein